MSSSHRLTGLVAGGIEGGAVLPAAPDHPQPGPGQDPDGVRVATSSVDRFSVDLRRPRVCHAAPVGEVHDGRPQLLVARPAEHDLLPLARLPRRGAGAGKGGEGAVGGEPLPAVPDLGEQRGSTHHPRAGQACEDLLVGMDVEPGLDLVLEGAHLGIEDLERGHERRRDLSSSLALRTGQTRRCLDEAGEQHVRGDAPG